MENVDLTNDLIFNYQIDSKDVTELLQDDLKFLNNREQVNKIIFFMKPYECY